LVDQRSTNSRAIIDGEVLSLAPIHHPQRKA
jgi:hypothetical protein